MSISGREINQVIGIDGSSIDTQAPTPLPAFYSDTRSGNGGLTGRYDGMSVPWGDAVSSGTITNDAEWVAPFNGRIVFSQFSLESDGLFDETATMKTNADINVGSIGHWNMELVGKVLTKARSQRVSFVGIGDSNMTNPGGTPRNYGYMSAFQFAFYKETTVPFTCWMHGPINSSAETQDPVIGRFNTSGCERNNPDAEMQEALTWIPSTTNHNAIGESINVNFGYFGLDSGGASPTISAFGNRCVYRPDIAPFDTFVSYIAGKGQILDDTGGFSEDPTWFSPELAGSTNDITVHVSYFKITSGGDWRWRIREYGSTKGFTPAAIDTSVGAGQDEIGHDSITFTGNALDFYSNDTATPNTNRIEVYSYPDTVAPVAITNIMWEFPNRPAGIHCTTIQSIGGGTAAFSLLDIQGVNNPQKAEFFRRIAELSAEDDPQVVLYSSLGGNDYSGTNAVTAAAFKTSMVAICGEIRTAWASAGLNSSGLTFLLMSYHTFDDAEYGHRTKLRELAQENQDTAFFDIPTEFTTQDFIDNEWYDSKSATPTPHLRHEGYLNMVLRMITVAENASVGTINSSASAAIGTTGDGTRLTGYHEWPDTATFNKGDVLTFNYELSVGNGVKFPTVTNYVERV